MASTYTTNQGIEKPAAGDQSGTWGGTVNTNMDIIDRAICGVASLTLTGSTTTLTTTDGTLTDGMYRVLILGDGGDLGSDNTITISPNDQSKCYLVYNNLTANRNAIFTQGSGANATVENGETAWIYADGAGGGAAVRTALSSTKLLDQDGDTGIRVEEGGDDDDTIRFDIAGAEDFTMTANTFTALSGSDVAIASGATITNSGTTVGFPGDTSAYSGVLEANANFVDQAIFGPSVDGKSWNGKWSVTSLYSSLMLVTIEDTGADTEVNIWDLTEVSSSAPSTTPLGTVTLSGDATPTSVAACMGYIIVGSEDGISIIDPHGGSWAERTTGWPRSLTSSTTPALHDNDIEAVAAGVHDDWPSDPRTGGTLPCFAVSYGTGAEVASLIKYDGNVFETIHGTVSSGEGAVAFSKGALLFLRDGSLQGSRLISTLTADDDDAYNIFNPASSPQGFGAGNGASASNSAVVSADPDGLSLALLGSLPITGGFTESLTAMVTRAYNTGYMPYLTKGAWLANSATTDRSYKANTLTENGTVTEAAVESGAELMGYSGFDASNNLTRAADVDFDLSATWSFAGWFKSSGTSANEVLLDKKGSTDHGRIFIAVTPAGAIRINVYNQVPTLFDVTTSVTGLDNGAWHMVQVVRRTDEIFIYVDGVDVGSTTGMGTGDHTDADATLNIGIAQDGSSMPATSSTFSLFRLSDTAPNATQIRQMYDAEKGMFVASAECLLQSGSTDAVLDVDVDPLTNKTLVTQTDAITVFDGLVVDSKPTVNSGNSEKGKLWGDLRAEQNSANAYVTAPAVDQRQVNEMVRGLAAGLPAGVDLSKAKAWIHGYPGTAIYSSHNVKSLTSTGTGVFEIEFAVPFKYEDYAVIGCSMSNGTDRFLSSDYTANTRFKAECTLHRYTTTANQDGPFAVVFFGELENE